MGKITFKLYLVLLVGIIGSAGLYGSEDSVSVRVHFLHGSKPKLKYKKSEDKWFGGVLGGHTGIEYETNKILNFHHRSFHVFSNPSVSNSNFVIHDTVLFYEILGGRYCDMKRTIITIKISGEQKLKLDSIAEVYKQTCPYDYAFFGMRCGAAAYDVLANSGVVKKYSFKATWRKIFYPRKLRRRLEHYARDHNYKIEKTKGCPRRRWERD